MLSVVMPLYNEGNLIAGALQRTCKALATMGPCEIIAVDDGSSDHSLAELERSRTAIPNLRVFHQPHSGKGEALRLGTRAAIGEFVIFLDADLDLPPEQILFFIAVQKSKAADAVIGSKMHPESTVEYPLRRKLYSWLYYLLVKLLFGLPIRDTQTGLKLVRRDLLMAALEKTQVKGFAFDLELLVRLVQLKARMVEAPVVVRYRMKFGGVGFKTAWSILRETLQTWARLRAEPRN